jgi:hypothetical protein
MSIIVNGKQSITFLHIPKTAGTSILDWLRSNSASNDTTEWDSHPKHSSIWSPHSTSFTVIRNPWDRMVSAYHYLKNISLPEGSSWLALNNITKDNFPTFEAWIGNLHNYKNPDAYWFRPETQQVEWLDKPVDIVLNFENLAEDFKQIQHQYGCFNPLPVLYASKHKFYKNYYTEKTKSLVAKFSQRDIDIFKYSF